MKLDHCKVFYAEFGEFLIKFISDFYHIRHV